MPENNYIVVEKSTSNNMLFQHFHNANEILYIKEGSIDVVFSGKVVTVNAPTLLFINNLTPHSIKINSFPYVRYFMLITNDILHHMPNSDYLGSIFIECLNKGNIDIAVNEWKETATEIFEKMYNEYISEKEFNTQYIINHFNNLLIEVYRRNPDMFIKNDNAKYQSVMRIKHYIDDNFEENITIESIAKIFFLSTSFISHSFKELIGLSPKQYLMSYRIAQARQLLLNCDDSVSNIAFQCGFRDVNNFIRSFKSECKVSPLQFRRENRHN